ncbi:MAG: glycosyltransferase family 9 protein [Bacteroidales bacterium]
MRLLFCYLRTHGDIIRTFPMLDAIKEMCPDTYIGYTCYEDMVETCNLCPSVDEIFIQPRILPVMNNVGGTRLLNCSVMEESINRIREAKFDIYVDLQGVFQSALIGCLANIQCRVGRDRKTTKDGAHLFYSKIQPVTSRNKMERHFDMCKSIFPTINPNCSDMEWTKHTVISIFPGSSLLGALKRWPITKYNELRNMVGEKYSTKLILGPDEYDLINYIPEDAHKDVVTIKTWNDAKRIIEKSRIVIGNDTAYLHMAIWKRIPTIMICGPTSHNINGVWRYSDGKNIISHQTCKTKCDVWKGKCDNSHMCLDEISVDEVYSTVRKYM